MKQSLESLGWKMFYQCNCGAGKLYFNKADKPGYEIRVKTIKTTVRTPKGAGAHV